MALKKKKKTKTTLIESRKDDHLDLCSQKDVQSLNRNVWDDIRLPHKALPEIDFSEISLETHFLGQKLKAPFLISSMTGGTPRGEKLNIRLAEFAQEMGIAMGVGSQRIQLEHKDKALFEIRKKAPRAVLYANIGAVQLNYSVTPDDCQWLVEKLEANALILHCNPLQEAIQREGDRNFKNIFQKIEVLRKRVQVPIILKETGCGIDLHTAQRAQSLGLDAIDVAGLGGTHWGFIEGLRDKKRFDLGTEFRNWGIPTPEALASLRQGLGDKYPLIASGGLRSGLDAAKAFSMGADLCGMALPFLKAAEKGEKALLEFYGHLTQSLQIALFCTGCVNPLLLKT